jgi:SIR2-like domain
MTEEKPARIVYLFGAGATHAELQNLDPDMADKQGLLVSHLSARVIEKARRDKKYLKDVRTVSGTKGSLNIELLISLIENSKVPGWGDKTQRLKDLVREDIEEILSAPRIRRFYLHKALFELHKQPATRRKERLVGLISLNYDDVLDTAYEHYYGPARYCFSLDERLRETDVPLLKLHGSFNWIGRKIRGRKRNIEIIPLGSTKNYIHPPYGCIWNQALETLINCDTLRVIGCSLSQNDFHLIDLLFKAHLERGAPFDIEIIAKNRVGDGIRGNYGFFPALKTITEIKDNLVPEADPENPFKTWLKYKSLAMLGPKNADRTTHVKKVVK